MSNPTIGFGIINLTVVPVRSTPSDKAEMVTQLLFGDVFVIHETSSDEKWVRLTAEYDGYSGWIDQKQYLPVSESYYQRFLENSHDIASSPAVVMDENNKVRNVPIGATLPFLNNRKISL